MRRGSGFVPVATLFVILSAGTATGGAAQERDDDAPFPRRPPVEDVDPGRDPVAGEGREGSQRDRRPDDTARLLEPAFLIDAPVDRNTYPVGPGDRLIVSISGAVDLLHELPVTPEGTVVLPTAGVVRVLGLSLEEAEERIRSHVLRFYRNVDVYVTLSEVRAFKVFVVGHVEDPGPRVASSVTRVSELVPVSDSLSRNVILRRSSGETVEIDLTAFRQTGDLRFNPTVREGDTVVVPGRDRTIAVYGRVFFPGAYEYRSGETLAGLLNVANGGAGFPSDAHDVVRVSRFIGPRERRFLSFTREEATGSVGVEFEIQPFDAVYVPGVANYKRQRTATVEGEVAHPGTFPIRPDTTTVRELIEMAGGFTTEASLVAARLRRSIAERSAAATLPLEDIPPEFLTEDERRVLRVRQTGDPQIVVVDFEELFREGRDVYNLALQHGDTLVVPESRDGVTVLGAVHQPGIVGFAPARDIEEYVMLAGGTTDRADEGDIVVLKARSQTQLDREEVRTLEAGDTIIVPFETERDWLETWQTTFSIVTGVTSLVLSFIAATR